MKNFEKIVTNLALSTMKGNLEPLQFAHKAGGGVEDAKLFILNLY